MLARDHMNGTHKRRLAITRERALAAVGPGRRKMS
jgi:hypothetical protein